MIFKPQLRDFIRYKVSTKLRSEASNYYLSYLWWVLEPIFVMMMFYFVFVVLLKGRTEDFTVFLLCGIVPMQWFQKSISNSMMSIVQNKGLILQVSLDKRVFPTIAVLSDFIKQQFAFLVLFAFLIINGHSVNFLWLQILALVAAQLIWIMAVAFWVAAVVPFLPDLKFIISIGLQGLFFLSGIFYSYKDIPLEYQDIFLLNPMAFLIKGYRDVLLNNQAVDWQHLSWLSLTSLILLGLGSLFIKKQCHQYPRVLS